MRQGIEPSSISINKTGDVKMRVRANGNIIFIIQAILLLFLSYGIAFIVTSTIHELGHVIIHLIKGSPISRFVIHPFLMSYVSVAEISMEGFENHIAGTILDLFVCFLTGKIFWKNRSISNFPLLTLVPIALIMEGFNISTGPISPGSDFHLIMEFTGLPAILFLLIGIGLVCLGVFFFMPLFPLLGIAPE
jgi:hypothetical protein